MPILAIGSLASAAVLETQTFRLEITETGQAIHFIDKSTGADYCASPAKPFASLIKGGKTSPASAVQYEQGKMTISFADAPGKAVVKVDPADKYLLLTLVESTGIDADEIVFLDVPLTLAGTLNDPFAACALALNLKTDVAEIPGPMARLRASCCRKFGMDGATAAVIGCAQNDLRDVMKQITSAAPDVPKSTIGGPYALDAEINRGSYLFDFGDISDATVDSWIACVKSLGLNQIDFHAGKSLRFGDLTPDPGLYPKGRESVKAVLDKLHDAGISAGLHTYSFFIAKDSHYITPVPDPRLAKSEVFTLAADLPVDGDSVPIEESTKDISTITGFFVRNSVTIQIDDELITFGGAKKEAPFAFTGCKRGAYGTKAAAHQKGAKVGHLKEMFGLFVPDADSTMLEELAKVTADTFNECGFDMIYLDALDGEGILGGDQYSWHYGSKYVWDIAKNLKKSALFEMSTFHHHLWYVRARMGAWDHPTRAHKRFIDVHCKANQDGAGMFLPMNLGWWAVKTFEDGQFAAQNEPTYPDDIEYLLAKALGNDMGISLMGVNPKTINSVPAYTRLAPMFKQYEDLRHAKYFSEEVKAKLRVPGDEYTLEKAEDGKWRFRQIVYAKHKVQGIDGWSNKWVGKNRFADQPAKFRIETLFGAKPYDSGDATVVEDFSKPEAYAERASQQGVQMDVKPIAGDPMHAAAVTGASDRPEPNGSWARMTRKFEPVLNIKDKQALGVWVEGDGQGGMINVQVRSPEYTVYTGTGDHYINNDFTGRRYFELVEPEGGHIADFAWPYSASSYANYRENIDYSQLSTLSLWWNMLPQGKPVTCRLSAIKATPLVKNTIKNPKLTINGVTISMPLNIETGSYLEFTGEGTCKVYGPKGDMIAEAAPQGTVPTLKNGDNTVEFSCDPGDAAGIAPRAWVTMICKE
jgi:hypothetical protein